MKTKARGYRVRTEDTPGDPVMFRLGVNPVWAMVMPVVEFATALTNDDTKTMTRVKMRTVLITLPPESAPVSIQMGVKLKM